MKANLDAYSNRSLEQWKALPVQQAKEQLIKHSEIFYEESRAIARQFLHGNDYVDFSKTAMEAKYSREDDVQHQVNIKNWKDKLNPFQKLAHAVFGDNATKLGVPAKPEHPNVISARKAAERREYFGMDTGFTGHDN